jgi:hypothetical protein
VLTNGAAKVCCRKVLTSPGKCLHNIAKIELKAPSKIKDEVCMCTNTHISLVITNRSS